MTGRKKTAPNLIGQRFGRWTVVGPAQTRAAYWSCHCECGTTRDVDQVSLLRAHSKSCGCTRNTPTHGMCGAPEYRIWAAMRSRCNDPKTATFHNYGGRGIVVCERWKSFEAFYADMGPRPSSKHTLDRINNDGNYEPGNCRWATRQEQANNMRTCVRLSHDGKTHTLAEWARETGMSQGALLSRLKRGWSIDRTLTTPVEHAE
jgi:hypothetical protein